MLSGYKTYIFAALLVINGVAESAGWWSNPDIAEMLNWIFGGSALASLRAGIPKS